MLSEQMAENFVEPKLTIQSFHQCASLVSIKLTSNNYLLWKSQVLPLIKSLEMEHHIAKDKTPTKMVTQDGKEIINPEFIQWMNNDGLLMTWLRGMMVEDVLSLIVEGQTACEVWLSIEEQMLPTTKEQESWLKDSLYSLKKGNTKLEEFLKKFKSLCDNLTAIGKPISDEDKVFQLARSLGPKFADFKTTMLTKPPYPTLKQFILALQNHEQTIMVQKQEDVTLVNQNQAFFGARGRGRNQRGGRNGGRGRGFVQNGGGPNKNGSHSYQNENKVINSQKRQTASNAQTAPKSNANHQEKEDIIICQICGKKGHSAAVCWSRYEYLDQEEVPLALAAMNFNESNDQHLYVDSGASAHMVNDPGKLDKIFSYKGHDKIFVGNGQKLDISHIENISIKTKYGPLLLKDVLVVPQLKKNLLSVAQLTNDFPCSLEFDANGFIVKNKHNKVLAKGSRSGNLYVLEESNQKALNAIKGNFDTIELWHKRVGHPSLEVLRILKSRNEINFSSWNKIPSICASCQLGKSCKLPFNLSNKISEFPLQKVHCDLWGPAQLIPIKNFDFPFQLILHLTLKP